MKFTAHITIMPLKNLLDPQGKAVLGGLHNLGIAAAQDVRVGKKVELHLQADSKEAAHSQADEAAKKLLANAVMEFYEISIEEN
jgi:phosphoribosylformylglycinamidine synthase subunit PurS